MVPRTHRDDIPICDIRRISKVQTKYLQVYILNMKDIQSFIVSDRDITFL
nr:MAG TPA: hypothetical protein [Caudoviricetes sp.]